MGGHKTISGSAYDQPQPLIAPYNITGTLSPNATCNYFLAGTYGGKLYYRRADGLWYIWWNVFLSHWVISSNPGNVFPPLWTRLSPDIIGNYGPSFPATGTATVSAGPH